MPKIVKGSKVSDLDKKKLLKMKKDGATRSDLCRVRASLLLGKSFNMSKKVLNTPAKIKRTKVSPEVIVEEVVEI